MIYSDKQRRISAREVDKLKAALAAAVDHDSEQAWLQKVEADALGSEIDRLEADIAEYDMLKAGEITFAKSFALESLPSILVRARIAAGMTQTDLAAALEMKPQQVQRYEASDYQGASLRRLIAVSDVLGVQVEGLFGSDQASLGGVFSWGTANEIEWRRFPIKEMVRRRWFEVAPDEDMTQAVATYFRAAAGPEFVSAYHRKKVRGETSPNEYALLAWQARVLDRARRVVSSGNLPEFTLDDRWLEELTSLTRRPDGPRQAVGVLSRKGIVLLVENHLPGTYLDGAAMLGESGHPIIALTLRFDRLDNFWFVLLHELGHVFLHLMAGMRYDFFDDNDAVASDRIEAEADEFALDNLIAPTDWAQCLSRFAVSDEAVQLDAERLDIAPSIIAGRIRRERNDYLVLNDLIGQGHVRSQFA